MGSLITKTCCLVFILCNSSRQALLSFMDHRMCHFGDVRMLWFWDSFSWMLVLVGDFNVSVFFSKSLGKEQICPSIVYLSFLKECHFFVMHCHSGKGPAFDILVTGFTPLQLSYNFFPLQLSVVLDLIFSEKWKTIWKFRATNCLSSPRDFWG